MTMTRSTSKACSGPIPRLSSAGTAAQFRASSYEPRASSPVWKAKYTTTLILIRISVAIGKRRVGLRSERGRMAETFSKQQSRLFYSRSRVTPDPNQS